MSDGAETPDSPEKTVCPECNLQFFASFNYCPGCGVAKGETLAESMTGERIDRGRHGELALSEKVFKRILGWAGILVAPIAITFAILGFQYNNFLQKATYQVRVATERATKTIHTAQAQAQTTIETSRQVQQDLESARHVAADLRKLRTDVDSLQSQVEGFYRTQRRELYGGRHNAGKFSAVSQGKWALKLSESPIPESLNVRCGAILLYQGNYTLSGATLTVNCGLDIAEVVKPVENEYNEGSFIEVLYHPKSNAKSR